MRAEYQVNEPIAFLQFINHVLLLHHTAAQRDLFVGIFALHTVAEAKPAVYTLVGIIAHGAGIVDDKVCLLTVA